MYQFTLFQASEIISCRLSFLPYRFKTYLNVFKVEFHQFPGGGILYNMPGCRRYGLNLKNKQNQKFHRDDSRIRLQ